MSAFVEALVAEIADLEDQLALDPRHQKLRKLKRVRDLYVQAPKPEPRVREPVPGSRPFASGASAEIIRAAKEILSGAATPTPTPTPTRQILARLAARGVAVGGTVPQNVLSSILSKSDAFKSHGRSGWTLAVPTGHETETEAAGDDSSPESPSPATLDHRPDQPVESPQTRLRPGGGT